MKDDDATRDVNMLLGAVILVGLICLVLTMGGCTVAVLRWAFS